MLRNLNALSIKHQSYPKSRKSTHSNKNLKNMLMSQHWCALPCYMTGVFIASGNVIRNCFNSNNRRSKDKIKSCKGKQITGIVSVFIPWVERISKQSMDIKTKVLPRQWLAREAGWRYGIMSTVAKIIQTKFNNLINLLHGRLVGVMVSCLRFLMNSKNCTYK